MRKSNLLLVVFLASTLLLLADGFTSLNIDSLLLSLVLGAVAVVSGVLYVGKVLLNWPTLVLTGVALVLLTALGIGKLLLIWRGDWQTQTIEYQHRRSANRVIAFQLMNPGPGSYEQRRVDRTQLLPGVSWTKEVDAQNVDFKAWERVDIEVNEMGLKYP